MIRYFKKRGEILLIFLTISLFVSAQTELKLPENDGKWKDVLSTCWIHYQTFETMYSNEYHEIISNGDTLFNDTIYFRLFDGQEYQGALRQVGQLVYYRFSVETPEVLLYDFGITAKFYSSVFNREFNVVKTDSILISNVFHRRIFFDELSEIYIGKYWIEGIGSSGGLLKPLKETPVPTCDLCCGVIQELICFVKNDLLFYKNEKYSDCNGLIMNSEGVENNNLVLIFPNPTKGIFYFKNMPSAEFESMEIFNAQGNLVKKYMLSLQQPEFNINQPGVYLIRLNGRTSGKIFRLVVN